MSTLLAALTAVAAMTATYFFCVRPMRRGSCTMGGTSGTDSEIDRQLTELEDELRALRTQIALETAASSRSSPGHCARDQAGRLQ